ncbi:hypothetical protein [Sedimenticola selenatireducens]|uniref:Uncharacterized protein n=1 Tax=Sedimenticola selenatireducens TaxID=191960 RepID=A0A557SCH5_9GAMM|nr:hypothetical protein [Sedimenticola selenatireducens]TVO75120.1 hypothetical protein FHP88_08895 [Sedimenticola selenatireducens]TVT67025.1 MAG: hypothetical protein FHK78_01460 [Sedimenticola selenatireducens]
MQLKNATVVSSADGKFVKLTIKGTNNELADAVMTNDEFTGLLAYLIESSVSKNIANTLPLPTDTDTETHELNPLLLLAKHIDVVRYETGGCAIQLQTTHNADFQFALDAGMTAFLRQTLNKPLP